jgi:indole-3-glycerol phosphate synthase
VASRVLEDDDELEELHDAIVQRGLECVVQVDNEEDLESVLERIDPEVVLLMPRADDEEEQALEHVLDLLPSVPAGKLAIADVPVATREQVVALERAGIDAVIVAAGDVRELVGGAPPEV